MNDLIEAIKAAFDWMVNSGLWKTIGDAIAEGTYVGFEFIEKAAHIIFG